MIKFHITLLACLLATSVNAAEEEKPPVSDVDLKGLVLAAGRGRPEPVVIEDAEALKKIFDNEGVRAAILKQVDLKTQTLVYFAWSGSGQDQMLSSVVKDEQGKSEVRFILRGGLTRDLRPHHRMFAVTKGVTWKMGNAGPGRGR